PIEKDEDPRHPVCGIRQLPCAPQRILGRSHDAGACRREHRHPNEHADKDTLQHEVTSSAVYFPNRRSKVANGRKRRKNSVVATGPRQNERPTLNLGTRQSDSQRGDTELPRVRLRRPDVECWNRVIRENRRNARGTHLWIIIHSCGEPNVVATTGTRITYEHARALERRAPRDRATRGMAEREGFEPSRDATIAHRAMPWKPSRSARPSDARDGGEREI